PPRQGRQILSLVRLPVPPRSLCTDTRWTVIAELELYEWVGALKSLLRGQPGGASGRLSVPIQRTPAVERSPPPPPPPPRLSGARAAGAIQRSSRHPAVGCGYPGEG